MSKRVYEKACAFCGNDLTEAEMLAVDAAQDGDKSQLWRISQSWTPAQREYAKRRYGEIHNLFAITYNP